MFWLFHKLGLVNNITVPEKFFQLLKKKGHFHECQLSLHPDKCCDGVTATVLNFDSIKNSFCQELNIARLGSVDALYLSQDKKKLFLIEMKHKNSTKTIQKWVTNQLSPGEIQKQIIESIFLILGIIGWNKGRKEFYTYFLDNRDVKIDAVFVCNCSLRELVGLQQMNLSYRTFRYTNVVGNFEWHNCDTIKDFFLRN